MRYEDLGRDDRIHASLYTDPRIFADEMERIFHRGWVFVGHASEVPRPGDFVTRPIGTQPAIMVRGQDGEIAVLLNRCMHRGTMICAVEHGTTRRSRVPITAGPTISAARCSACRTRAGTTRRSTRARAA